MTVASEVNRSGPYIGNGVTTVFDYGFRIVHEDHLRVIRAENGVETDLVIDADYIVSDVGEEGGGQIACLVAPSATQTITILLNVPFTQETDLENQGAYFAQTVEDAFDLAAMRDLQLSERLDRALAVPASADASTLNGLISDVLLLADHVDEIDTVAGIDAAVVAASGNAANINAVSGNAANINAVSGNAANINAVSGNAANINTVADHVDEIDTVAGIDAAVVAVAGNAANISTVAGIADDVSDVADIAGDVTTVAANLDDVKNFADVYQGPLAEDPETRSSGDPLEEGDFYFNTVIERLKIYSGVVWLNPVGIGDMLGANNLSEVSNAIAARDNLELGNVDNTSDADKPVSSAQAASIATKSPITRVRRDIIASSTLALGDAGNVVAAFSATDINLTVPVDLALPVNSQIDLICWPSGGSMWVVAEPGVTIMNMDDAFRLTPGAMATLYCMNPNLYLLGGSLSS